ncbi:MAG: hypothetical protein JXA21_00745 [Anaerolineae bacterium]|nr:hypothetical protein [Anaerolineae bacterium]
MFFNQSVKPAAYLEPKVLVITFAPRFPNQGGRTLYEVCGWNDPQALTRAYIADLETCSGGYVHYVITDQVEVDAYPVKKDGFRYTHTSYMACRAGKQAWHQPDAVNYHAIFRDFNVAQRVASGEIDEVWLWGFPYGGFWESTMAGPGAYFCNSSPVEGVDVPRIFVTMGFSYERGVGEMLENFGHRAESILTHVFGSWDRGQTTHAWNRFTLYDKVAPGMAACGNVHFAPNSAQDYDWGNPRVVSSDCEDWLNYPDLTGQRQPVTCVEWGNGDVRSHHRWWLSHLPHAEGRSKGKLNNWWAYIVDFNRFPESR